MADLSYAQLKARALRCSAALMIMEADVLDPSPELSVDVAHGEVVAFLESDSAETPDMHVMPPAQWLAVLDLRQQLGRPLTTQDLAGIVCSDRGDDRDA